MGAARQPRVFAVAFFVVEQTLDAQRLGCRLSLGVGRVPVGPFIAEEVVPAHPADVDIDLIGVGRQPRVFAVALCVFGVTLDAQRLGCRLGLGVGRVEVGPCIAEEVVPVHPAGAGIDIIGIGRQPRVFAVALCIVGASLDAQCLGCRLGLGVGRVPVGPFLAEKVVPAHPAGVDIDLIGAVRQPRVFAVALCVVGATLDAQRLGCRLGLGVGRVPVGPFLAEEVVPAHPAGVYIDLIGGGRQPRVFAVALSVVGVTLDAQRLGCRLGLGVGRVPVGPFLAEEVVPAHPAGVYIDLIGGGRQPRVFAVALSVVGVTLDAQRLGCRLGLGVGRVPVGPFLAEKVVPAHPAGVDIDLIGAVRQPRVFAVALCVVGATLDAQRLGCRLGLGVGRVEVGPFIAEEVVPVHPAGVGIDLMGAGRQPRVFAVALCVVGATLDAKRLGCRLGLGVGIKILLCGHWRQFLVTGRGNHLHAASAAALPGLGDSGASASSWAACRSDSM